LRFLEKRATNADGKTLMKREDLSAQEITGQREAALRASYVHVTHYTISIYPPPTGLIGINGGGVFSFINVGFPQYRTHCFISGP
jgi:hypothetical protein